MSLFPEPDCYQRKLNFLWTWHYLHLWPDLLNKQSLRKKKLTRFFFFFRRLVSMNKWGERKYWNRTENTQMRQCHVAVFVEMDILSIGPLRAT